MIKTQKYFVILGVMSFWYWFLNPLSQTNYTPTNYIITYGIMKGEFLPFTDDSVWYNGGSQILSFVLIIGSGLGYYLFKDD